MTDLVLDQTILIDRARALGDSFAGTAAHHDATAEFPVANLAALFESGLLNLNADRSRGGFGFGLAAARAVVSEIARGEPSTALVLAMHYNHHRQIAAGKWPEHLADRACRANLLGPALLNSAQVEPRIGSPSHGSLPETVARRDGDVWRITGHKTYATGITLLKWVNVLAVTDEAEPRLASFFVPTDAPGLRVEETWNATGMRATASHDLILTDVAVPLEDIIEPRLASEGLKRDEAGTAWYFLLIASVYHGVARAAADWITQFATTNAPGSLGAPLSTLPRFEDAIGEIEAKLFASERLLRSIAEDADAGRPLGLAPGLAKLHVVDNAVAITTLALDLGGNPGLRRDHPLERHHRDALCGRAHAPQNAMIRTLAARAAFNRGL